MAGGNPLEKSDEDFLNEQPPAVDPVADEAAAEAAKEAHDAGDPEVEADPVEADPVDADTDTGADTDANEGDADGKSDAKTNPEDTSGDDPADADAGKSGDADGKVDGDNVPADGAEPGKEKAKDPVEEPKDKAATEAPAVAAKGFTVPTKFQANGKDIELKSEGEALQLMQMGANYTRKMQELAPHRKVLLMLQNNDLLDESKLSFLIDLDKKNPEAIKKLMKDSGIDPTEIDLETDTNYLPGTHIVGNEEVGFRTVLEEISSTPAGKETITALNTEWDDASKEVLWKQPELLTVFHEQRQSGVYTKIKAEVDRQIALGTIPVNTPFLEAYRQVGTKMVEEATSQSEGQQQSGTTEGKDGVAIVKPSPVATRAAAPKADLKNGDKASAASPTRAAPGTAKTVVNPLAMSDDQFLKDMEGRV